MPSVRLGSRPVGVTRFVLVVEVVGDQVFSRDEIERMTTGSRGGRRRETKIQRISRLEAELTKRWRVIGTMPRGWGQEMKGPKGEWSSV